MIDSFNLTFKVNLGKLNRSIVVKEAIVAEVVEREDDWVRSVEKIGSGRVSVKVVKSDGGAAFVEMSTRPVPATRNISAKRGGVSNCEILKHGGRE